MYKFLGIQSRRDAEDQYQPKGDYLTPQTYEKIYGSVIDSKFQGYLPIGDYVKLSEFNSFKDELKTSLGKSFNERDQNLVTRINQLQPKGDYVTSSMFNDYTKKTDSAFDAIGKGFGTIDTYMKESKANYKNLSDNVNLFQSNFKPALDELNGRMQKNYLTKDEFEDFKSRLYNWSLTVQNNNQLPLTNYGINIKGAAPTKQYLRTRNYMFY